MELDITLRAKKDLRKLPKNDVYNILEKIYLASEGNTSNIKKLTNHEPNYRLRVGNYRVLFDINNDVMVIQNILHRKDAYNK